MKHSIGTIALATLVAIASLTQAHAQDHAVRVNVPFAFNSGSAQLVPGTYTIEMQGADVAALSNVAKPSTRLAVIESRTTSGPANAPASVTFRKYGNNYFLASYSIGGTTIKLIESNKERSLSREEAMSQTEPSLVQLAALGQ